MKDLGSQYLSASAGSGKTFALSRRYCRLVMAGARPETICALTFTRAATREIFAAVVERLLNHEVESAPGWLTCDQALEVVLDALPRLQISTIDAFSSRVARLFAYELGLSPDFMLYEEGDGPEAKAMLRETVNRALRNTPAASSDELLNLFDVHYEGAATAEALSERLRNFLHDFGVVARNHPDGWGDLSRLGDLPQRCANREALVQTLREVPVADVSDAHAKSYFAAVDLYHPELKSIREWKARVSPDQAKLDKLRGLAETGIYKYYKKVLELGVDGQAAAKALWDDLLARDLRQTADHTASLHRAILALNRAADGLADETVFDTFIAELKAGLKACGLDDVWPCFIVGKVGTDLHTVTFDKEVARKLTAKVAQFGSYIKGHYTDGVLNPEDYPLCGMGAANVGPEFTISE